MISSPNYGSLPRRSSITSENSSEISAQNYRRLSRRNSISSENVSMMPAQNFGSLSRRNSITSENLSMISAPNYDSLSRRSSITSENPTVISAPNHRRLSRRASIPSENPSTIPAPNYESLSRRTSITSENPSAMYVPNAEELSRLTSIALENSSMIDTPNYESEEERDTVQDLRISTNEVRGYVASLAKHKNKSHYQIEDEEEEHEEIYEKEANNRIFRENERNTDAFNQDMELAHQNDKRSISNENSHINNINEKAAEDHTYDILYERYKPLAPTDDKNEYPLKEVKVESNKQENVTYKQEEVKELKTSLMDIVSPFIPFKETSRENEPTETTQGELNEQKHTSKAVNRFFCNEIYEERKIPSTSEPDPDFSNNSRDSAYSGKAKVKKRRPKASKLREMNVWGPSSM
ncbi:unnamed protein product [Meganyctiphanes norvegica]|uniref:Uncharacterized protein n=1 Tax=Meganyctiphanes norvegica TaxID=48144 RepID=A0AAV2QLI3_MEGNR